MILITGASGQLGTELKYYLDEINIDYVATDSEELDITNSEWVEQYILKLKPTYVFHCAAYTAVDEAEDNGKKLAYQVNVEGTKNIANAAQKSGAMMIYISTDYVFDGKDKVECDVQAETHPLNVYGETKYLGEEIVKNTLTSYYIIRTSWVFGQYGHNFVFTMQKLAKQMPKLMIVNDQVGRPTWTRTLAEFMIHLIQQESDYGIYHLSNDGQCTWYEFACEILKDSEIDILPVTSEQFVQKAQRPQYSVLSLVKAKETGFKIPHWKEALKMMLEEAN